MKHGFAVPLYLLLYAALGLLLEWKLHRRRQTAQSFLHTRRDLSLVVTSLSFLAANCSALEVLTVVALAVKYGMLAVHFYWIGATPALAYLLWVLLPRFQRLQVRSIPEYLEQRFSPGARLLSALAFSALTVAIGGITLSIAAQLLRFTVGCSLGIGITGLAAAACLFLLGGGLSAVLYAEALQLLIFLFLLCPLIASLLHRGGGMRNIVHSLPGPAQHTLAHLPVFAPHAPADLFGVVVGLGGVLSFTYWCADFLLIQRIYAARNTKSALHTPALAICAKLLLPLVLVLPGLWLRGHPLRPTGGSFDLQLPALLLNSYAPWLAAAAVSVMIASLFLGLCGNLAAGIAIFTSDVQQGFLIPLRSEHRQLAAGRWITVAAAALSALCALRAEGADAAMEKVQLVLSAFNVPVGMVFLLGMSTTWFSANAGLPGIAVGTVAGLLAWAVPGPFGPANGLAHSFYTAIVSAAGTLAGMLAAQTFAGRQPAPARFTTQAPALRSSRAMRSLAIACLLAMAALYLAFP